MKVCGRKSRLIFLMQAYLGIHQPENIDAADLARRRLIFDDFFYLQVIGLLLLLTMGKVYF